MSPAVPENDNLDDDNNNPGSNNLGNARTAFVALSSHQVARQVSFYQSCFLLEPRVHTATYAEFLLPGLKLAIFEPSAAHATEFSGKPLQAATPPETSQSTLSQSTLSQPTSNAMSVCIEVENLDAAIAHLHSLGYPPPGDIIDASHGKEIYAYDPDGNRLILHQS